MMSASLARSLDRATTLRRADANRQAQIVADLANGRYRIPSFRGSLVRWPNDLSKWNRNGLSGVTPNNVTAPNGALTADTIVEDTTNTAHAVYGSGFGVTSGASYIVWAIIGPSPRRYVSVRGESTTSSANYPWLTLDTQSGTIATNGAVSSADVTPLGGGWFLVAMRWVSGFTGVSNGNIVVSGSDVATAPVVTSTLGNAYLGTSQSFVVWGAWVTPGTTVELFDYASGEFASQVGGRRSGYSPSLRAQPGASYTGGAGFKLARTKAGLWVPVAANEPGETDAGLGVWEARANSIRNPTALGLITGVIAPGATVATNWAVEQLQGGLSLSILGSGVESGLPYVEMRLQGTATNNNLTLIRCDNGVTAASGQTWAMTALVKQVSGTPSSFSVQAGGRTSSSTSSGEGLSGLAAVAPASPTQLVAAGLLAQATTAFVLPWLCMGFANGTVVDATFRWYAPNLKQGAYVNDPPILQTNNLAATRTADAAKVPYAPPSAGWLFVEFLWPSVVASGNPRVLGDGQVSAAPVYLDATTLGLIGTFNGSNVTGTNIGTPTPGQTVRVVVTWDATGRSITANSRPPSTDTNSMGLVSGLALGWNAGLNSNYLNSTVRFVSSGDRRLTTAEMQAMTAFNTLLSLDFTQ